MLWLMYNITGRALNSDSRGCGFDISCLQFSFPFFMLSFDHTFFFWCYTFLCTLFVFCLCLFFCHNFISSTLNYSISMIELTEAAVLIRTCAIQCYTMYIVHIQKCPLENRTGTIGQIAVVCS